jgi:hypothetical protein
MAVPTANLSTIVTGAMDMAKAVAAEMLPAAVKRADAVVEATRASAAWVMQHLWAWVAVAADSLPAVEKLPDVAAKKLLSDASAWFSNGHRVAVYATMALVLLAVAFLGGAIWALTCRTRKGPGLGGARVPRAVFKASPKRYYATVRSANKLRRRAGRGTGCSRLLTGLAVAFVAYLAAKVLY